MSESLKSKDLKTNMMPVCKNPCPYDGHTKREYVKQLVRQLNLENPGVKKRLFSAIQNGNIDDWIKCTPNRQ